MWIPGIIGSILLVPLPLGAATYSGNTVTWVMGVSFQADVKTFMHFVFYLRSICYKIPVYGLRCLSVFAFVILDGFYTSRIMQNLFEIAFVVMKSS